MPDDRLRRIALLLRALDDCDRERSEYMTELKDRRTKIEHELAKLKDEILTGQQTLPIETEPEVPCPAST